MALGLIKYVYLKVKRTKKCVFSHLKKWAFEPPKLRTPVLDELLALLSLATLF